MRPLQHIISKANASLQPADNLIRDPCRLGLAAEIGGKELALSENGIDGRVDPGSGLNVTEGRKQECGRSDVSDEGDHVSPNGRNGVGNVLALDVGSRAVDRLTHDKVVTGVDGGNKTKGADKGSGAVTEVN